MQVLTTDLDQSKRETYEAVAAQIRAAGFFFVDPDAKGESRYIYAPRAASGELTARRLMRKSEFVQLLLQSGLLQLMKPTRDGLQVLPASGWLPYMKILEGLDDVVPLDLPPVNGMYRLPCVVQDGSRLVPAWPGRHAGSGLLFTGTPWNPDRKVDRIEHLKVWLSGLEFSSQVHRGNLLGFIVSCFARNVCPQFPFLILDATDRKQGKTTLATAVYRLLTGRSLTPITHTGNEGEIEKRIAGLAGNPGPNLVVIDNVRPKRDQGGTIRSQFFATAATCPLPSVRPVYGKCPIPVDYPIIMLTMNAAAVEPDLFDRTLRVVLDGQPGRYFAPNPDEYVQKYRDVLIDEIMTILGWMDLSTVHVPKTRFGTWERIASLGADYLDLEYNLDPDVYDTPDAIVKELIAILQDYASEGNPTPDLTEVAGRIRAHQRVLPELWEVVRSSRCTSDKTAGDALALVIAKFSGRELCSAGKRVIFTVTCGRLGMHLHT